MKYNRVKLSLIPKLFAPAIAIAFILLASGVVTRNPARITRSS